MQSADALLNLMKTIRLAAHNKAPSSPPLAISLSHARADKRHGEFYFDLFALSTLYMIMLIITESVSYAVCCGQQKHTPNTNYATKTTWQRLERMLKTCCCVKKKKSLQTSTRAVIKWIIHTPKVRDLQPGQRRATTNTSKITESLDFLMRFVMLSIYHKMAKIVRCEARCAAMHSRTELNNVISWAIRLALMKCTIILVRLSVSLIWRNF